MPHMHHYHAPIPGYQMGIYPSETAPAVVGPPQYATRVCHNAIWMGVATAQNGYAYGQPGVNLNSPVRYIPAPRPRIREEAAPIMTHHTPTTTYRPKKQV